MATTETPSNQSASGVDDIISELHERGVRSGREEAERIIADARLEAANIIKNAEKERERIVAEGHREAERLVGAAQIESEQMLESFMASLPEIFSRHASRLLDKVVNASFDPSRSSQTITDFLECLEGDREARFKELFSKCQPQNFVEGLMIMAVAFYAQADGLAHFALDPNLKNAWARVMGDSRADPSVSYEFREGITGFTVTSADGREVEVSPEAIKHMAEAWAGEQFRHIYVRLKAQTDQTSES